MAKKNTFSCIYLTYNIHIVARTKTMEEQEGKSSPLLFKLVHSSFSRGLLIFLQLIMMIIIPFFCAVFLFCVIRTRICVLRVHAVRVCERWLLPRVHCFSQLIFFGLNAAICHMKPNIWHLQFQGYILILCDEPII